MGHILIVDDEETLRSAVRMTLERASHTVEEAADGEAALKRIAQKTFDAVLLDMRMPGLDGPETLTRIRASHPQLPVIMVTGYGSNDSMQDVLRRGASLYISKPFKNKELLTALSQLVKTPLPTTMIETSAASVLPTFSEAGPSCKSRVWPVILVLILGAVGAGVYWHREKRLPLPIAVQPARVDFKLPYSNPTGLLWQGDKLWVLDWFTQSIYVHQVKDDELPIIKTYHLPQSHVTGMAIVNGMLYTSDSWSKTIRKHKLDDLLTVVATYPAPGPSPSSLFWDGKYLWCGDIGAAKIYQLQLVNKLLVIGSYPAPGTGLAGFYKDANFAWTADAQTRKLYKHRLNDSLTVIAAYSHPDFERGAEPISSFVWQGDTLWYSRDRKPLLSRRSKQTLIELDTKFPPR